MAPSTPQLWLTLSRMAVIHRSQGRLKKHDDPCNFGDNDNKGLALVLNRAELWGSF